MPCSMISVNDLNDTMTVNTIGAHQIRQIGAIRKWNRDRRAPEDWALHAASLDVSLHHA